MTADKRDSGRSAKDEERERDELLLQLLKTPPQPRPKRERENQRKPTKRAAGKSKRGGPS